MNNVTPIDSRTQPRMWEAPLGFLLLGLLLVLLACAPAIVVAAYRWGF